MRSRGTHGQIVALRNMFASALLLACQQSLDNKPCPCARGWYCCVDENVCRHSEAECSSGGAEGGAANSGGNAGISGRDGEGGTTHFGGDVSVSGHDSDGGTTHSGGNAGASGRRDEGGTTHSGGDVGAGGRDGEGGTTPSGGDAGAAGEGGTTPSGGDAGAGGNMQPVGVTVATQHFDNQRSGANLHETVLTTSNVNAEHFGKRATLPLRGDVYAQPLYVANLDFGNGIRHNVVYVATMRNYVYALDADDPGGPPLWMRQLAESIPVIDGLSRFRGVDIRNEIGILGTPVVDAAGGTLYVVAARQLGAVHGHTLFALNLTTGEDRWPRAPLAIAAPDFVTDQQAQRAALSFDHGNVYVPFAGYPQPSNAPGWVFTADAALTSARPFATAKPGGGAGVQMSGQGIAFDQSGSFYLTTDAAATSDAKSFGSALLAFQPTGGLGASYAVEPPAKQPLETQLGLSGPVLLPDSERVFVAGTRAAYLFKNDLAANTPALELLQSFELGTTSAPDCGGDLPACFPVQGSPVYWQGPDALRVYVWPVRDRLQAFRFDPANGVFDCGDAVAPRCAPIAVSSIQDSIDATGALPGVPGGLLAVSANQDQPGSGVVWAAQAYSGSFDRQQRPSGILRAYDAQTLAELWSSQDDPPHDEVGPMSPYAAPVVSGGQVFLPTVAGLTGKKTFDDAVSGFGPALTALGEEMLVAVWLTGAVPPQHLQLAWSQDTVTFSRTSFLDKVGMLEPAVASDGVSRVFVAWVYGGETSNIDSSTPVFLHVGVTDAGSNFATLRELDQTQVDSTRIELGQTSYAPALAYGNGKLFLAWKEPSTNEISLMTSSDGKSFDAATKHVISAIPNEMAVGLSFLSGKLYFYWFDDGSRLRIAESTDDGASFGNEVVLNETLPVRPGLTERATAGASAKDLYLFFASHIEEGNPLQLITAEDGELQNFEPSFHYRGDLYPDESVNGVSAANFRGQLYLAWTGTNGAPYPNIARYNPAGLVTYGLNAK